MTERNKGGDAGHRSQSLLSALLEIGEGLDLEPTLRAILEQACRLTGSKVGILATFGQSQAPEAAVFRGFEPREERELLAWPEGPGLVEHLRGAPGVVHVEDMRSYLRSIGLTSTPSSAFRSNLLGSGLRSGEEVVGYLLLADKARGLAFSERDERLLTLFARHAAGAVVNARLHGASEQARSDLKALIESSPLAVLLFERASGRLALWNREAKRLGKALGEPAKGLRERLGEAVCRRADGSEELLGEWLMGRRLLEREFVRCEDVSISAPGGRSVRGLLSVVPVGGGGRDAASAAVLFQDLSPIEETERLRTEFLALVGHGLRTPLAAIKGAADTLLDDAGAIDPAEAREFHRIIAGQADGMLRLVADLLDAGRIDSGTLSVSPEPSAVTDLVERAQLAFAAGAPGRTVTIDLAEGLPPVMADRPRIVQVLGNLFANAARHSKAPSAIRVAVAHEGSEVAVSVTDGGDGMPPERLARLFSKHRAGGAGLGLSICKGIVEAHGGRIRAVSEGPGRGTAVTFTLPAAPSAGAAVGDPGVATPSGPGKRPRVLVVEDDPHALRFAREALESAGYAPVAAGSPEGLGGLIRAERPALAVLGLTLPGADGLRLLQEVPELSDLPVLVTSAYGGENAAVKALEQGAEDYLVKPFSARELAIRVGAALRRRREPAPFRLGELAIHYQSREVTVSGEAVDLTAKEFEVLRALSLEAGRVVSHDALVRRVWGGRPGADANLVRVFVRKVRAKLGDSAERPAWIFNQRGVGYRMPKPGGD